MKHKFIWLTLFSIAMGFMETAVVVYLRKIYYPTGFSFPLIPIDGIIALTEVLREAATIVMLIGVGIICGKTAIQKFAYFIYSFAIWDIFYYVFLKLLLNWPESLCTWDILFLIPVPWVGPVLAPCILSLSMIILAMAILYFTTNNNTLKLSRAELTLLIAGSIIVILSFMWDYFYYINSTAKESGLVPRPNEELINGLSNYIPSHYNWWIFILGQLIILVAIVRFIWRNKPIT